MSTGLHESVPDQWRNGTAVQKSAAIIYDTCINGKKPGTALPPERELITRCERSHTTIVNAKRLLRDHGQLRREFGLWVVA